MKNTNNKIVAYYKQEISRKKLRVANIEKEYTDCIEAYLKFYLINGYFNEDMKDNRIAIYQRLAKAYIDLFKLEERFLRVKGCMINE